MLVNLRPHHIFGKVHSDTIHERSIKIVLPEEHSGIVLETVILIALTKIINVKAFFEIGTYWGVTALDIASNFDENAVMYTLDLDEAGAKKWQQEWVPGDYDPPILNQNAVENIAFLGSPVENKIVQLLGDSKKFDFSEYREKIDMIFIDGGHDYNTVKSDTENALEMRRKDKLSCIVWHDYENKNYPELTKYLDDLSNEHLIFRMQETMICFCLSGPDNSLLQELQKDSEEYFSNQ